MANDVAENKSSPVTESERARLIGLMESEVDFKFQQLQLQSKKIDHDQEKTKMEAAHAEQLVGAELEALKVKENYKNQRHTRQFILTLFCVLTVGSLIVVGLYLGHKDAVMELIKILGAAVVGFFGGRGYQTIQDNKNNEE